MAKMDVRRIMHAIICYTIYRIDEEDAGDILDSWLISRRNIWIGNLRNSNDISTSVLMVSTSVLMVSTSVLRVLKNVSKVLIDNSRQLMTISKRSMRVLINRQKILKRMLSNCRRNWRV